MLFRHWRRCKIWSRPVRPADALNSLHDAACDTLPGMMLVYEFGTLGHKPNDAVFSAARTVAARLGMAAVARVDVVNRARETVFALQRPGQLS